MAYVPVTIVLWILAFQLLLLLLLLAVMLVMLLFQQGTFRDVEEKLDFLLKLTKSTADQCLLVSQDKGPQLKLRSNVRSTSDQGLMSLLKVLLSSKTTAKQAPDDLVEVCTSFVFAKKVFAVNSENTLINLKIRLSIRKALFLVSSLLSGSFLIKFFSLSAPTKVGFDPRRG